MPNIYIRNIPAEIHKRIKGNASAQKQTLSIFLTSLINEALDERELRAARIKLAESQRRKPVAPQPPRRKPNAYLVFRP